jgi:hypothetical protein
MADNQQWVPDPYGLGLNSGSSPLHPSNFAPTTITAPSAYQSGAYGSSSQPPSSGGGGWGLSEISHWFNVGTQWIDEWLNPLSYIEKYTPVGRVGSQIAEWWPDDIAKGWIGTGINTLTHPSPQQLIRTGVSIAKDEPQSLDLWTTIEKGIETGQRMNPVKSSWDFHMDVGKASGMAISEPAPLENVADLFLNKDFMNNEYVRGLINRVGETEAGKFLSDIGLLVAQGEVLAGDAIGALLAGSTISASVTPWLAAGGLAGLISALGGYLGGRGLRHEVAGVAEAVSNRGEEGDNEPFRPPDVPNTEEDHVEPIPTPVNPETARMQQEIDDLKRQLAMTPVGADPQLLDKINELEIEMARMNATSNSKDTVIDRAYQDLEAAYGRLSTYEELMKGLVAGGARGAAQGWTSGHDSTSGRPYSGGGSPGSLWDDTMFDLSSMWKKRKLKKGERR